MHVYIAYKERKLYITAADPQLRRPAAQHAEASLQTPGPRPAGVVIRFGALYSRVLRYPR